MTAERLMLAEIFWRCVMQHEPQKASEKIPEENLGSLRGCLVEGDAEQRTRQRIVRRRALAISILVQGAVLTLVVLFPLFGKTERIALGGVYVPIPPYGRPGRQPHKDTKPTTARQNYTESQFTFHSPTNRPPLHPGGEVSPGGPIDDPIGAEPIGPPCNGCINIDVKDNSPRPPGAAPEGPIKPQIIRKTHLDPGMLIHRVEPLYPALARQIRREGRVELRAIIGTDGSIQSLQVVAGDPLFLQSAVEAVQQWRYKPTYLNGQAVEVDTYVTVVYTLQH
jgi:TonB family protein